MPTIKVLLADDHPLILEGVRHALTKQGMKVLAEVTAASEVLPRMKQHQPDVAVLDVRFGPGPTGLDVAREVLAQQPGARIVFYSQFDQDEVIRDAYRLGGAAFVTKDQRPEVLYEAITEAAHGKTFIPPAIAQRLAVLGLHGDDSPRARLDPRELEVFLHLASGLNNNEIAERMALSSKTIGMVGQTVREKLGVQRGADLTRLAVRHGMIDP
ncbi:response regulator transcription factor [Aquincola sp. J276]|uniref:response regulator n=1 Tax=Aquincola sp. J276 TaxID=2898432 RepID=UPI002150B9C4|nr:response regulator transcription factor [Aquincola sp. J276]MCR5867578.1 response regulator transcription factor [Aquincola sp. J276]